MRKLVLFVLVVGLIVIGVLLASKLLPGFDKWASAGILAPVARWFGGIVTAVTSHPFWIAYDVWIGLATGIVGMALFTYVLWPRAKKIKPTLQHEVLLQRDVPPSPPRQISATPVEEEAVEAQ